MWESCDGETDDELFGPSLVCEKKGESRNVKRLLKYALTLLLVLIFYLDADSHASSDTAGRSRAGTVVHWCLFGQGGVMG